MSLPPGVHDPSAFIDALWESVEVEGVPVRARVHLSEVAQSVEGEWDAAVVRNTLLVTASDARRFTSDALVVVRDRLFVVRETTPRAGSGMFWEVVLAEELPPRIRAALSARLPAPRAALTAALQYPASLTARTPAPRVAVQADYYPVRWRVGEALPLGLQFTGAAGPTRTSWDQAGNLQQAALNTPRDSAWVRDSQGNWVRVWLLEGSRQNLVPWAVPTAIGQLPTRGTGTTIDAFPLGGALLASGVRYPAGATQEWAYLSNLLAPNTQYTFRALVAMDDGSAPVVHPSTGDLSLLFAGASVAPTAVRVTRIAGTSLYLVEHTGTTPSTITGNNVGFVRQTTHSGKGFRVTGYSLEAGAFGSSLILTTGAALTRAAESAWLPWPYAPRAMNAYASLINLGTAQVGGNGVYWGLGSTTGGDGMFVYAGLAQGWLRMVTSQGSQNSIATTAALALGDAAEYAAQLFGDGSIQLSSTVNGGAIGLAPRGAALGLPPAWPGSRLWLGSAINATQGFVGFRSLACAFDERTLTQMRGLWPT